MVKQHCVYQESVSLISNFTYIQSLPSRKTHANSNSPGQCSPSLSGDHALTPMEWSKSVDGMQLALAKLAISTVSCNTCAEYNPFAM